MNLFDRSCVTLLMESLGKLLKAHRYSVDQYIQTLNCNCIHSSRPSLSFRVSIESSSLLLLLSAHSLSPVNRRIVSSLMRTATDACIHFPSVRIITQHIIGKKSLLLLLMLKNKDMTYGRDFFIDFFYLIFYWLWLLKVSKFQNEFMKSSFLPKYEQKIGRISAV